jgi:cellobiose-specific phosphotransferase system component IIA
MRTLIITLILATAISQTTYAASDNNKAADIQSQIMEAFVSSSADKNNLKILSLIESFSSSYQESGSPVFLYWKAYAMYYNSIIYLKNGDKEKSNKELNQGIEALESIKEKNSEDCALLSMLYSFSCQFLSFPKVIMASGKANSYAKKAIKLNENNLRAYYVSASYDYYTPLQYGGGKNVENYLLKALSLNTPENENPYLPSWGRQECFEMLTNYYIREKSFDKAKTYIEMGLKDYPNSNVLKRNKSNLAF